MSLPRASSVNNVFIGGHLNPSWSANAGSFDLEAPTNRAFVRATQTPSYFSAPGLDITNNQFSAKIDLLSGGSAVTTLIVKKDESNYVSISVGYDTILRAVSVSDNIPDLIFPTPNFPVYDPIAHAFWRITNLNGIFDFWTSTDSVIWTKFMTYVVRWDVSNVTVQFMAGHLGTFVSAGDFPIPHSYISAVNSTVYTVGLGATVSAVDGITAIDMVTDPNALSGTVNGYSGNKAIFKAIGFLAQGGLTDFSMTSLSDSARFRYTARNVPNTTGGSSVVWKRPYISATVSTHYRDGSYWPTARAAYPVFGVTNPSDTNPQAITNVQMEEVFGPYNRLSTNVAFYTDTCEYVAQQSNTNTGTAGSISVTRSKDIALAGDYSGKMVFGGTAVTDAGGRNVYYPYPTRAALIPISPGAVVVGSVSLSTARAGTQWYSCLVLYDANFNITSASTFNQASGVTLYTHPGGGDWQTATTSEPIGSFSSVWAAVVPVVVSSGSAETVYMSGHYIRGETTAPTNYTNPRELDIELKADRVNLVKNSGFTTNTDGWLSFASGPSTSPDLLDTFTRTVSNGWGSADIGGSWTNTGGVASDFSVNGSLGIHSVSSSAAARTSLLVAPSATQDLRVTTSTGVTALGASIVSQILGRAVDNNNNYLARLEFTTTQAINLTIFKRVAAVETQLGSTVVLPFTHVANTGYNLRFNITGNTLKAKAWLASGSEPVNWAITTTDSTYSAASNAGVRSNINGGNTNTSPVIFTFDNFSMNNNPFTTGWDSTVGFNSLGSLKSSFVPPSSGTTGGSSATYATVSALINTSQTFFPVITGLVIGTTYTLSVYVLQNPGCPNITMKLLDPNYQLLVQTDTSTIRNTQPNSVVGNWVRMNATFIIPPNGLSDYRLSFEVLLSDVQAHAPFDYWIDSILLEKGSQVLPYFDGSFGSADYQYESQGGPDNRSYYYRDFTNKLVRVNQMVTAYAPLGNTATITSAVSP